MPGRSNEYRSGAVIVVSIFVGLCGCSEDSTAPGDTTPPAAVMNLVAIKPTWNTVTLTWRAPGDDANTGTAAQYDIRYSVSPLTEAVWPSASQAADEPSPGPAGPADTFVVTGLAPNSRYYFALKTADDEGNWSAKSNITSAPTTSVPDNTPPAAVTDLAAIGSTTTDVTLTWTAPGDDGTTGPADRYDIRYSTSPIDDANWAFAPQAGGEPPPKQAGESDTFVVTQLAPGTIYHFALKTADETPNWSALSNVASGKTEVRSSSALLGRCSLAAGITARGAGGSPSQNAR